MAVHDVRQGEHLLYKLLAHNMEVCGLRWSPDGSMLASGSNDNTICLWSPTVCDSPIHVLKGHTSAVKVRTIISNSKSTICFCLKVIFMCLL